MGHLRESKGPETADRWAGRVAESMAVGSLNWAYETAEERWCTETGPRCPAGVTGLCHCWCRHGDPSRKNCALTSVKIPEDFKRREIQKDKSKTNVQIKSSQQ